MSANRWMSEPDCCCRVGGGIDELDGFVAQRRSTAAGSSEDEPYTDQLSNRALHGRGDLVPTCQPVQIAELAKSETQNDGN